MKNLLFVCLAILSFTCFSQNRIDTGTYNTQAKAQYDKAITHLKNKQDKAAKIALLKAISYDGKYVDALDKLGEYYLNQAHTDSAIFYYRKSIESNVRHLLTYRRLVNIYVGMEKYNEALDLYEGVLRQFANNPAITAETFYAMGNIYYNQKEFTNAIRHSEKAMSIYLQAEQNESAAGARLLAAKSYIGKGNYAAALKYLKASRKYYETKPYYHYHIGYCYLKLGKQDKADEHLGTAQSYGFQIPPYVLEEWKK